MNIIEQALQEYYLPLDIYVKNNIDLTKSVVIKHGLEASLFNNLLSDQYGITPEADKRDWRYYRHLSGQYYQLGIVDQPIMVSSKDNFTMIELTTTNLKIHQKTKAELLKFGSYYKEVVANYPYQELLIKTIINDSTATVDEIVVMEDLTIVSFNTTLLENQEDFLMEELQQRLYNYKKTWMLPYYANSDSLFASVLYANLYNFILTSMFALRLKYAKTSFAHTFHITNYLASHFNLDQYMYAFTREQLLYLYRNLLYLDNHSGQEFVFQTLIDKLFTKRNISIVNYEFNQKNTLALDNRPDYTFKQNLLNTGNLPYSKNEFSLVDIGTKESPLTTDNALEYQYSTDALDYKFKNSLFNKLKTKDLESIIIDYSDNVRYKLIPTIVDYFAYFIKTNRINFFINFINPINNTEKLMPAKDIFKLYMIALYYYNNIQITNFPSYTIQRVYRDTLPTVKQLEGFTYRNKYYYDTLLTDILNAIPPYSLYASLYAFETFVTDVYETNIGIWLMTTNLSDKNDEVQFRMMIDKMTIQDELVLNDETVDAFLTRYNMLDLKAYTSDMLYSLTYTLMDYMFNNKLKLYFNNEFIQQAIVEVFKLFKSYSTQLIKNYYANDYIFTDLRDTRYAISEDQVAKFFNTDIYKLNADLGIDVSAAETVSFPDGSQSGSKLTGYIQVDDGTQITNGILKNNKIEIILNKPSVTLADPSWEVTPSSQDDLKFLSLQP